MGRHNLCFVCWATRLTGISVFSDASDLARLLKSTQRQHDWQISVSVPMTKSSYCGREKLSVHRLVAQVKSRGLGKHPLFTRPPWFVRSLGITQRWDKPGYQVQFEINRCLGGFGYYQVQTPPPCKHSAEAKCLNYPWTKKSLQTKSKLTSVFKLRLSL